jgi:hypothetical protein
MIFLALLRSSEKQTIAPMGSTFSYFRPRRPGIPPIAKTPDWVEIYPKKRGGQGLPLLGCLPLSGREGVILQAAAENKRIEKKECFSRTRRLSFF